jgi:hypothetical protein
VVVAQVNQRRMPIGEQVCLPEDYIGWAADSAREQFYYQNHSIFYYI